jgi:nucleotide-binding universal stress UspA family protein
MIATDACTCLQLKNILFATNFSPGAAAAVPYAAALAKRYGAKLYVVEVRPLADRISTPSAGGQSMAEAGKIDSERKKQKILASFPEIQPEVLLKRGSLWSNIAAVIEVNQIDLIVIGTSGRSGITKLFLGSPAEEIFRKAACPVFAVGPRSPQPKRGGEMTSILCATDLRAQSTVIPYAISLAQDYEAHLIFLHVIESSETAELPRAAELLRNLVPKEAELTSFPECLVERGRASEKTVDLAAQLQVDLIVMGARPLDGRFRGPTTHLPLTTAHKVVLQAPCPVLTVRGRLA